MLEKVKIFEKPFNLVKIEMNVLSKYIKQYIIMIKIFK